ncbi:hypothetical protein IV203_033656 [Nitzschia inconspicua]|uniref:Uncharacterized protein n=1 Tax=Nitzschia inconspicua TaxID=303405 RepID=A0A9K3M2W0_9STRA|nr:hypothetical protein IV203_033656 [Nitzschia inconspicua]
MCHGNNKDSNNNNSNRDDSFQDDTSLNVPLPSSDKVQQQAIIDFVDHIFEGKNSQTEREEVLLDLQTMIDASVTFKAIRLALKMAASGRRSLSDKELDGFARAIKNSFEKNDSTARPVYVDYQITNTALSHDCDLVSFAQHIETLANEYWSENHPNNTPPYVAPYFCLIQSSGMGKTKLLYEYRKAYSNKNFESKLILVGKVQTDPMNESVYDAKYAALPPKDAESKPDNLDEQRNEEAQKIYHRLDTMVTSVLKWEKNTPFRVLLFDEAQFLLKEEFGMEAFQFRCVRLWLRQKQKKHKYVAVFTGTNSGLANFEMEADREVGPSSSSRRMNGDLKVMPKGSTVFPHFVMLTTIGCLVQLRQFTNGPYTTEYDEAIIHGRPLFSVMKHGGQLDDNLPNILCRMLLSDGSGKVEVDWEKNLNAWFSILATRVQMGITSIAMASNLVANGYANLTHVSADFAQFTYLPDPVCARLAMGMMSDRWKLGDFKGRSPSEWVQRLGQIYSSGLCRPEKGDFGEVLATLYFLLCGDILRHRLDGNLNTFSVDLDLCFDLLMNGGNANVTKTPDVKQKRMDKEWKQSSKTSVTLSCIQFCRNYIRSYEADWSSLGDQQFLRHLYASGTGFFTSDGCPTIDAVLPLCIRKDTSAKYIPCFLSIKSHKYFAPGKATKLCNKMKSKAEKSNLQALCIVVVFGSTVQSNYESVFDSDTYSLLEDGETVAVVLRIPADDIFGISKMFLHLTGTINLMEVYASHPFIRGHTGTEENPALDPINALRESPSNSKQMSLLKTLSLQLKLSPPSK